jgi:hypothetical protein
MRRPKGEDVLGLPKEELHARFRDALGSSVTEATPLEEVPMLLSVVTLARPLAVYAFTVSNPPGGRSALESKIQLMTPTQRRGERAQLVAPGGHFLVLVGVVPDKPAFVLWDAYLQSDFTWSKNVQVRTEVIWQAGIDGIATRERRLRTGRETVIVARADRLLDALKMRISGP